MGSVQQYEHELGSYLHERLSVVPGVTVYGPTPKQAGKRGRASLASFNVEGLHATGMFRTQSADL